MRLAALALAAALGGCGDPEVEHLARIRAEVCACKSVACAEAALAQVPSKPASSNFRTQAHARAMLDCLAKLHDAPLPPDAADASSDPADSGSGSNEGSDPAGSGSAAAPPPGSAAAGSG